MAQPQPSGPRHHRHQLVRPRFLRLPGQARRRVMKPVRCAIYTRKSSEEGLEQDFNSLDAQFAACSAYIASQASEGWTLINARYDDGGISGGTLERPALQRLRSEEHTSELQSLMRTSYAVFCLKKKPLLQRNYQ